MSDHLSSLIPEHIPLESEWKGYCAIVDLGINQIFLESDHDNGSDTFYISSTNKGS